MNVDSVHELAETGYILINEERMKLPMPKERPDPALGSKFIQSVIQVSSVDELYDLFDLHKDEPHKFVCMLKSPNSEPKDFSLQNKMFRKFFYENSSPVDDVMTFVEIKSLGLALRMGLERFDQVIVV